MVICHSYVSLPEGNCAKQQVTLWSSGLQLGTEELAYLPSTRGQIPYIYPIHHYKSPLNPMENPIKSTRG